MHGLYLVGVDYRDMARGPGKLEKLYEKLRPDVIITQESLMQHDESSKRITGLEQLLLAAGRYGKHEFTFSDENEFIIERICSLITPFTTAVSQEYARRYNAKLIFGCGVELPYEIFRAYEIMGAIGFSLQLMIDPSKSPYPASSIEAAYYLNVSQLADLPQQVSSKSDFQMSWAKHVQAERRLKGELLAVLAWLSGRAKTDGCMAKVVESAYSPDKTVVVTADFRSLADSALKLTLYSKLKHLSPERIPLL